MFVELLRNGVVESRHRVHAAVVGSDGRLVARAGDPTFNTFMRSVAKPFQAMPLVADGVVERFGLTSEDLALACASHSSEPEQVEGVRAFLARVGASEADLLCGAHQPLSEAVARDYSTRGVRLSAIHSNCSGKHTGMVALARHHGWPVANYVRAGHPVQRRCLAEVSRWTGVPEEEIGTATDGCGVVCFAVPVAAMGVAYARLANSEVGSGNAEHASEPSSAFRVPSAAFAVSNAFPIPQSMLSHPHLIAGSQRPCTEIMTANPGAVIAKVGAEGVYAAAIIEPGLGVALKIEDGHGPASALAIAAVLEELGLRSPDSLRARPVPNSRGEIVGELRVKGGLSR